MVLRIVNMLSAMLFLLLNSFFYHVNVPFAFCTDSASSFFESHEGYFLHGHVIDVCKGEDLECGFQCLRNCRCQSFNCFPAGNLSNTQMCHLNNETRKSRPEDFKENQGATYFELMQVANSNFVCKNDGRRSSHQNHCICHPAYRGITCQSKRLGIFSSSPGYSCKHIRDSGDSKGDGEYWIDPEKNGNPLKVFCDMTTDGGGWLLSANIVVDSSSSPSSWTAETSYRGISNFANDKMAITASAMKELRSHLSFTQLRFHCSKQKGRTFHVITAPNSTCEAVVQYFSGQTDVLPFSCNSFQRMNNDNSKLAVQCEKWGNENGHHVGKWGHFQKRGEKSLYDHAAFVAHKYHWHLLINRWLCDDNTNSNLSPGDFWKIYVR